jgi:predicted SprT family Zn-dependent metalloprotease
LFANEPVVCQIRKIAKKRVFLCYNLQYSLFLSNAGSLHLLFCFVKTKHKLTTNSVVFLTEVIFHIVELISHSGNHFFLSRQLLQRRCSSFKSLMTLKSRRFEKKTYKQNKTNKQTNKQIYLCYCSRSRLNVDKRTHFTVVFNFIHLFFFFFFFFFF